MTMSEDLRAHTIPTDLPPNQTRSLIIRQLQKVQQVSQPVLQQLDQAISAETGQHIQAADSPWYSALQICNRSQSSSELYLESIDI